MVVGKAGFSLLGGSGARRVVIEAVQYLVLARLRAGLGWTGLAGMGIFRGVPTFFLLSQVDLDMDRYGIFVCLMVCPSAGQRLSQSYHLVCLLAFFLLALGSLWGIDGFLI